MEIKNINVTESHLVVDLFNKYRIFYKQDSDLELAGQYINNRLAKHESIIFVALQIKAEKVIPVGFAQLYPNYSSVRAIKNWVLNDLYVDVEYRNQGIGEALINATLAFAKSNEAKFVRLETAIDNYSARHLYETIGFKKQIPDNNFIEYQIEIN